MLTGLLESSVQDPPLGPATAPVTEGSTSKARPQSRNNTTGKLGGLEVGKGQGNTSKILRTRKRIHCLLSVPQHPGPNLVGKQALSYCAIQMQGQKE